MPREAKTAALPTAAAQRGRGCVAIAGFARLHYSAPAAAVGLTVSLGQGHRGAETGWVACAPAGWAAERTWAMDGWRCSIKKKMVAAFRSRFPPAPVPSALRELDPHPALSRTTLQGSQPSSGHRQQHNARVPPSPAKEAKAS